MCKEDIRIKRKTGFRTWPIPTVGGVGTVNVPGNADRVAILVSSNVGVVTAANWHTLVQGGPNLTDPVVAGISLAKPTDVVTIEQIGLLITLPLYVQSNEGAAQIAYVTELFFIEPLKDL